MSETQGAALLTAVGELAESVERLEGFADGVEFCVYVTAMASCWMLGALTWRLIILAKNQRSLW